MVRVGTQGSKGASILSCGVSQVPVTPTNVLFCFCFNDNFINNNKMAGIVVESYSTTGHPFAR